jgi:hypothetical protein
MIHAHMHVCVCVCVCVVVVVVVVVVPGGKPSWRGYLSGSFVFFALVAVALFQGGWMTWASC